MWQESGPDRESRTSKCISGLVWLGEEERSENSDSAAAAAAVGGASNSGSKRFTHVFSREWAIPEDLKARLGAPATTSNAATNIAGNVGGSVAVAGGGATATGNLAPKITVSGAAAASVQKLPTGTAERGGSKSGSDSNGGAAARPKWAKPLTDLSISVGDMVCVSAQGGAVYAAAKGRGGVRHVGGGGGRHDHVRLLTGNISAVFEDRVEVSSDRRLSVPRRGGIRSSRGGCRGNGAAAGEALDIEDLFGGGTAIGGDGAGGEGGGRVLFRIDKDEWAAGIK